MKQENKPNELILRKCEARHHITEEIIDAYTDGKKIFDEEGNELDINFSELPSPKEALRNIALLITIIALIGFSCWLFN